MAITKEQLQKSFESLSTRYGGSLLQEKQLLNQEEVTVFIGLGGLGGRAVNAIKAITKEKLNNPDRRFFLAVDTCKKDMNDISVATKQDIENPEEADYIVRGCLEEDEKLALYKDTYKIKTLGHDIDSWLNRAQLAEVDVDDRGAQGIRQIGRVMLMANGNYEVVYSKISNLLNKAKKVAVEKNVEMKIYIVAGISGGTGSGTVIDFTYMVKRATSGFAEKYKKIDAILFTPDVQFNDQGVDANKQKGLKANFYAAIKEIDFFYNNKSRKVSYKCPYTGDEEVYKEDIFDACTLISRRAQGVDVAETSNGVIKKVADALAFEISGIKGKTNSGANQSYTAFFSNVSNNFQLWWPENHAGKGLDMPDWAPSRYSSLAYSSFYIPRDELVAYCANRLMERLADHWKQSDITEDELKKIFREHHIISNKSFAAKLLTLGDAEKLFDVDKEELPVDGFGILPVKNCKRYLDFMHETAVEEGSARRVKILLQKAKNKQDDAFVKPIISLVDKAFADEKRGPVYAINLLSAGIRHGYNEKSGVLAKIRKLIADMATDASAWELELSQQYADLNAKAEKYDGSLNIDADVLNTFTEDCHQYGLDLLKCKILKEAEESLVEIYNKLLQKNETVFEIYTYAFEYLVKSLKKDADYVANTNRHREGQTTIFSFDLTEFQEEERNSQRFKLFFEGLVSLKEMEAESKAFVKIVFGGLKERLDPATGNAEENVVQPEEVVNIIREYFRTSFAEFTESVIEQFCVVAYSNVDATPDRIAEIWNDPQKKAVALNAAATAINAKITNERRIMLSCADVAKDMQNFCSYETFAALHNTPNINNYLSNPFILEANWSEFIGYKRIFGFPICLLADLGEYKKEYDAQAITSGIHLDEMYSEEDGFGDWRHALPEPYGYKIAKALNKYEEGGNDTAESDRKQMINFLELAKKAKALGLLIEKTNNNDTAGDENIFHAENGLTFYELVWKLVHNIDDINSQRNVIYSNILNAVNSFIEEKRELNFLDILTKAGYKQATPTQIQWTFNRPEFNVMGNRTDMGDSSDFGNFIVLIRSNPYWGVRLNKGVELFGNLYEIYTTVLNELNAAEKYNERILDFAKAIRVGRIVPFYDNGLFVGYSIKVSDNKEEDVVFVNSGLDAFDQKFLLYLCFTETYFALDDGKYKAMKTLVEHDFSLEKKVDYSKEARDNVDWFIEQTNAVKSDKEYLAHYDEDTKKQNFAKKLNGSRFEYALPISSRNKEDVEAVIKNLDSFYNTVREHLNDNRIKDVVVPTNVPVAEQPVTGAIWSCSCGTTNTGKFCQSCGKQKPEPNSAWTCSCGALNTGKFCQNCGKTDSKNNGSWFCQNCGTSNTGKFCQNCGAPGVNNVADVVCGNCGWKPEVGKTAGKFCPSCGTPLN